MGVVAGVATLATARVTPITSAGLRRVSGWISGSGPDRTPGRGFASWLGERRRKSRFPVLWSALNSLGWPGGRTMPNASLIALVLAFVSSLSHGAAHALESSSPWADCNGNAVEDSVDIAVGRSADVNQDGIPDECQAGVRLEGGSKSRAVPLPDAVERRSNGQAMSRTSRSRPLGLLSPVSQAAGTAAFMRGGPTERNCGLPVRWLFLGPSAGTTGFAGAVAFAGPRWPRGRPDRGLLGSLKRTRTRSR